MREIKGKDLADDEWVKVMVENPNTQTH